MTYRGWKWLDDATEEQTESATNRAACDRLAAEARSIYDSIYDPRDEYQVERFHGYVDSLETEEEQEKALREHSAAQQEKRGGIAAIEELLAVRGARFARDYEHWNEDEKAMEYAENRYDEEGDR